MSRRRRTSPFEDLIKLASILPYWVSLIIAVVAYLFFHSYAISEVQPVIEAGSSVPQNMGGMMFKTFSTFLQYIIPAAFVFGAVASGFKSYQARVQVKRYEQWSAPSSTVPTLQSPKTPAKPTDEMNWAQFELLVGEAFRKRGFRVIHGGDVGADGGVDVRLRKNGKEYLVQCKHWKTKRVGVTVIRELYGVMVSSGVAGGYVVTSGEFTEEAKSFSEGKSVKLVNSDALARILGMELEDGSESEPELEAATPVPSCPNCGSEMVKRLAKRGPNAGNEFWGCFRFPKCRGTLTKN